MATGQCRVTLCLTLLATLLTFVVLPATAATAATCESLALLEIPFTAITLAQSVPAGTFQPPSGGPLTNVPAFCRIALTIAPTSDSNIRVEVWMPTSGWNGRFEGTGGGGYTGSINYTALANAVRSNYAVANTDMGTSPATVLNGTPIVGHPEKWLDFGSRSTHEMTVAAKTLVQAFYGEPAGYSYFVGCSTGGHQGLEEAQIFPDDYNGILAGAPGHNRTHLHTAFVWNFVAPRKPPASLVSPGKLAVLNSAVLQACVGHDGGLSTDGFLTDPRDCGFDPASLQCPAGDAVNCLTSAEIETVKRFYDGPRNPRTGERIYPGWPLGSETGWSFLEGTTGPAFEGIYTWALGLNYDPLTVDFDSDMARVDAILAPSVNFMSSDLHRFEQAGGKLLVYQGFADFIVSPLDTINYYKRLSSEQSLTTAQVESFARLFMVPGMGHCSGGSGPNVFDALTPLVQWVEHGVTPDTIVATKFVNNNPAAGVQMTRPLCLYPREARYVGAGDPNLADSFACVGDAGDEPPAVLPGRDYLAPLVIEARVEPKSINLRSHGQFTVFLRVAAGSDGFDQWTPSDIRAEGAPARSGGLIGGSRMYIAHFRTEDLAGFTGGKPAGEPVDLMITGVLDHNGFQSLFATSATVTLKR